MTHLEREAIDNPASVAPAALSRRAACRAAIAAVGAAMLCGMPRLARAAEATKETTDALAAAQSQFDEAQAQMDQISAEFTKISQAQDETIGKIEKVQEKIDDAQEKIDEKRAQLEDRQAELSDRVSSSYKSGNLNVLTLMLASTSLSDLIDKSYYLGKMDEADRAAIGEVRELQQELEDQKAELESQRASLEKLKATQDSQLEQMKAKKDEVQKLVDGLSSDVKDLMAKRDAELLASVKAEEEARRALEEAKKQAAANAGSGSGQALPSGNLQQRVVSAARSTPSPGAGLCAAWVSNVFAAAGLGYVPGNADDMYSAYCGSSNRANLKVGMIIAVSSHPHTSLGAIYGHVGIYVGGDTVMDNVGYIRSISLDAWCNYYGLTVTPRWGWASGINLEG